MANSYYFNYDKESSECVLHLICKESSSLIGQYRIQNEKTVEYIDFFDEEKFIILLDDSSIYTGKVGEPTLKCLIDAQGRNPGYWLDKKKNEFWLATTTKVNRTYILQQWDLNEFKLLNQIELPKYIRTNSLTKRKDGCFVFYKHKKDEHGFYCTNPSSQETKYHKLESKPVAHTMYLNRNALFIHEKDIAVLPAADDYISSQSADETIYEYQIQLIDLNDFTIRWKKTVHGFTIDDICDDYYDEIDVVKKDFDDLVVNNGYKYPGETHEKWTEFLDSIMACEDEDAFWLRFSNESIVKVNFEGDILTPVYTLDFKKDNSKEVLLEKSVGANKERIMMLENTLVNMEPYYYIDLTQESYEEDGKFKLNVKYCKDKELKISDTYRDMVKSYGVNLIEVSNLSDDEGEYEAVKQIASKMKNIDSLVYGDKLVFEFVDSYGEYKSENDFIGGAVYVEKNLPIIKEYLELFFNYPDSKKLVDNEGKPVFSETLLYLVDLGPQNLDMLAKYYNAIDPKLAEYHIENIIPAMKEHFGETEEYEAFEKAIPKEFSKKKKTLNWF